MTARGSCSVLLFLSNFLASRNVGRRFPDFCLRGSFRAGSCVVYPGRSLSGRLFMTTSTRVMGVAVDSGTSPISEDLPLDLPGNASVDGELAAPGVAPAGPARVAAESGDAVTAQEVRFA